MATTTTTRRRKGIFAFAVLAVAALLVAVFASLHQAAPATADSPGLQSDPQATGCYKDAVTVKTVPIIDATTQRKTGIVEVRYSPHCGTNWVRATSFIKGVVQKMVGNDRERLNGVETDYGPGTSWSYQVKAPGDACMEFEVSIMISPAVWDGTAHGRVCGS